MSWFLGFGQLFPVFLCRLHPHVSSCVSVSISYLCLFSCPFLTPLSKLFLGLTWIFPDMFFMIIKTPHEHTLCFSFTLQWFVCPWSSYVLCVPALFSGFWFVVSFVFLSGSFLGLSFACLLLFALSILDSSGSSPLCKPAQDQHF